MAKKIWTAEEIGKMTPQGQQALFDASIVYDLDGVPTEFLDRVRAKVQARIAEADTPKSA